MYGEVWLTLLAVFGELESVYVEIRVRFKQAAKF
jgi:hypothetical protein